MQIGKHGGARADRFNRGDKWERRPLGKRPWKEAKKGRPGFYPPLLSFLFFLRSKRPGFCFTSTSSANMNVRDFPCQSAIFTYSALGVSMALMTGVFGFPISGIFFTSFQLFKDGSTFCANDRRVFSYPNMPISMKKEKPKGVADWKASKVWRMFFESPGIKIESSLIFSSLRLVPEPPSLYSPGPTG